MDAMFMTHLRTHQHPPRRNLPVLLAAAFSSALYTAPAAADGATWTVLQSADIVLFRHANAPGVGDPAGFALGNCSTQRNLDAKGRVQAQQIGQRFAAQNIAVGAVISSQWCRTMDTAQLAFPGRAQGNPIFNSFFDTGDTAASQTTAARVLLLNWNGPGALVVFTHQVNITALTGVVPSSAEGVVVRKVDSGLQVVGHVQP